MKTTEELYTYFLDHPSVVTDSRIVSPGAIFFGLKGEVYDGNLFAAQALEKGASLAVVDDPSVIRSERYLLVGNALLALQELATLHRIRLRTTIIAVTGSNGKTTTKELLGKVLATTFQTVSTQGNLNNHIGVPLTILSLDQETEIAVVEMGANHPGEITSLCRIAQPDFGLVTNFGKAHLEGFGSFEGVIRAKSELFDHLRLYGGITWVNGDDALLLEQSAGVNRKTYGTSDACDCKGKISGSFPMLEVTWTRPGGDCLIRSNLYGDYNFSNIMAAVCAGDQFGISPEKICDSIAGYVPDNNRSQVLQTGRNRLILDAYNANPSSMKAALENFSRLPGKKKMVIAGDMLELGQAGIAEHQAVLRLLDKLSFDLVLLVGPIFSSVNKVGRFLSLENTEEAMKWIRRNEINDFTILLKGSRLIGLEKLIDGL